MKPGKPFTQKFDDFKGRLHVSLVMITIFTLCSFGLEFRAVVPYFFGY